MLQPKDPETERALRAANGHDARERATWVVVGAAIVLMVLLVVRLMCG